MCVCVSIEISLTEDAQEDNKQDGIIILEIYNKWQDKTMHIFTIYKWNFYEEDYIRLSSSSIENNERL